MALQAILLFLGPSGLEIKPKVKRAEGPIYVNCARKSKQKSAEVQLSCTRVFFVCDQQ